MYVLLYWERINIGCEISVSYQMLMDLFDILATKILRAAIAGGKMVREFL